MFSSASQRLSERIGRSQFVPQSWRSWAGAATVVGLLAAGALLFDAVTPQIISVGIFYVGLVLVGFWFPKPKAALALALLATPLIVVGYWITIPDNTPAWQAWTNRALAIGTVWLTAIFVWRIRLLEQKLQVQIDIADSLSQEMNHRVGNHLQLVASFLKLQAASVCTKESSRVLELAASRVMVIGNIQRMLSHSTPSHGMIDSKTFITALIRDVRSALPDPERVSIAVSADSTELTSTRAIALGALLLELINNALKHAFREGMNGTLIMSFVALNNKHILELEDDGIGIDQGTREGFGMQNVAGLARLLGGSITCQPAHHSNARPGTKWRLVIPA